MGNLSDLSHVLRDVFKKQDNEVLYLFALIQKNWEVIVGESLATKTAPKMIYRGKLVIIVEDSSWSHHLKYYENQIVQFVEALCGTKAIKAITFHVEPLPERSPKAKPITDKKRVGSTKIAPGVTRELEEASPIEDKKIRKTFARFMAKSLKK